MKLELTVFVVLLIVTAGMVIPAIAQAEADDDEFDLILSGHHPAPYNLYAGYIDIRSASVSQDADGNYVFQMTFYGAVPTPPLHPANGKPVIARYMWRLRGPEGLVMRVQLTWNGEQWSARYGEPTLGHLWVRLEADKFSIVGSTVTVRIPSPLPPWAASADSWNAIAAIDDKPGLWFHGSTETQALGCPWFLWDGYDGGPFPP